MASRKFSIVLAVLAILSVLLSACGAPAAPASTQAPAAAEATKAPAAEATQAPAPAEPTKPAEPTQAPAAAAPAGDKYGGILRHAYFAVTNLDPAFLSSISDDEVGRQWADFLVYVDEQNQPDPSRSLAEKWEASSDGLTWTFAIRQGVKFHSGKELTAQDVKFTFDRLRDKAVGAATVELYSNITDISAPDDATVVIKLAKPNPDFLLDLGDYHTLVVNSEVTDFKTVQDGTGPFMVDSYLPEDRMVFERNPNYWMKDAEGKQLPYLDGMEFIFMAEASAQVEALRGGQVDYLLYLPAEFVKTLARTRTSRCSKRRPTPRSFCACAPTAGRRMMSKSARR